MTFKVVKSWTSFLDQFWAGAHFSGELLVGYIQYTHVYHRKNIYICVCACICAYVYAYMFVYFSIDIDDISKPALKPHAAAALFLWAS